MSAFSRAQLPAGAAEGALCCAGDGVAGVDAVCSAFLAHADSVMDEMINAMVKSCFIRHRVREPRGKAAHVPWPGILGEL
jgi:hypothetical protein